MWKDLFIEANGLMQPSVNELLNSFRHITSNAELTKAAGINFHEWFYSLTILSLFNNPLILASKAP